MFTLPCACSSPAPASRRYATPRSSTTPPTGCYSGVSAGGWVFVHRLPLGCFAGLAPTSTLTPTVAPTATAVPLPTDPPALTRSTRVITAAYDGLQRLIAAREQPGTFFRYDYDLAGNRTGVWVNGAQTAALTYNAADQVDSWQYDSAGNLLSDGSHQWTYDALGRMTGVQMNGEQGSYTYNGDGVLVRAQGSWGQNERYPVDLASPLSQVLQVQYPMGSTTALYGQGRLGLQENGATTWLLSDALGSVRQTADSGGTPGWGVWYDPWGQVEQGAVPTFGFAGEQHDTFTGQVYLRARWYAPQQGRFLSWRWAEDESDDLVPYSHHAYAYAHSSPFNWTDPSGKCLGWMWGDPNCQLAWKEPSKWDYAGTTQVAVTGMGVAATVIACVDTAGIVCAIGAAGAGAVTSWGNQALDNAGKPVPDAVTDVDVGRIAIDAIISGITGPLGQGVNTVAGRLTSNIGSAALRASVEGSIVGGTTSGASRILTNVLDGDPRTGPTDRVLETCIVGGLFGFATGRFSYAIQRLPINRAVNQAIRISDSQVVPQT